MYRPDPLLAWLGFAVGAFAGNLLTAAIHRWSKLSLSRHTYEVGIAAHAAGLTDTPPTTVPSGALPTLAAPARCGTCETRLTVLQSAPLVGYLWSRGQCAHCGADIPIYMPIVEFACAMTCAWLCYAGGPTLPTLRSVVAVLGLIGVAAYDSRTSRLPDAFTLPAIWLGLALSLLPGGPSPAASIAGALAGYGIFWLPASVFARVTGRVGMGHGDFKLAAAIGAWFGLQALPAVLIVSLAASFVLGLTALFLRRARRHTYMPFGPCLALGGIIITLDPLVVPRLLSW